MDKIAMYKEEIYKRAKLIVSRGNFTKDDINADVTTVIDKPWYRRFTPKSVKKNYRTLISRLLLSAPQKKIDKFTGSKDPEERRKLLREMIKGQKNSSTIAYQATKPLLFGRRRFNEMAKNPQVGLTFFPEEIKNKKMLNESLVKATVSGFTKKEKPYEKYKRYEDMGWGKKNIIIRRHRTM